MYFPLDNPPNRCKLIYNVTSNYAREVAMTQQMTIIQCHICANLAIWTKSGTHQSPKNATSTLTSNGSMK